MFSFRVRTVAFLCAFLWVALGAAGFGSASADCIDYSEYLHLVGGLETNRANDVVLSGDYAYVADGTSGIVAIDVSDPGEPVRIDSVLTVDSAWGIALRDSLIYVADYEGGFHIFNHELDPDHPVLRGSIPIAGIAKRIALLGDYALVTGDGSGSDGLFSVDVSNPATPAIVDAVPIGDGQGIALLGDYAFVADNSQGLVVVDASDPTALDIITSVGPGGATGIAAAGNRVYLARGSDDVRVFDATDPDSPSLLGALTPPDYVTGLTVDGDHVYISSWNAGLAIADASDPSAPSLVGICNMGPWALMSAVDGDYAYVAAGVSGLQVVDISNPHMPELHTSIALPGYEVYDFALQDGFAYLPNDFGELEIIDLGSPLAPSLVGAVELDTPRFVAVSGNHAFVTGNEMILTVVDISDPANPDSVSAENLSHYGGPLVVGGGCAYLVGESGFSVVDVSSAPATAIVAEVAWPDYISALWYEDDYLYIAANEPALVIYDVSVPSSPVLAGSLSVAIDTPNDILVDGGHAYLVSSYYRSLVAIDVSDPADPTRVSVTPLPDGAWDLAGHGGFLYASGYETLYVIDVTNPLLPEVIGTQFVEELDDVQTDGAYLYATHQTENVVQFSVGALQCGSAAIPDENAASAWRGGIPVAPNPSQGSVAIKLELATPARMQLDCFDVAGRLVGRLCDRRLDAGAHELLWDGTGASGRPVGAGVYFLRLSGGGVQAWERIVRVE